MPPFNKWRPHLSWRSFLVQSGIKMAGELDMSLGGLTLVASQGFPEETWLPRSEIIFIEYFNNVD